MIARSLQMKITRERLEQIVREELAAVAEGAFDDMSAGMGRFHPDYAGSEQAEKDAAVAKARRAARGPGAFDNMSPEEPDDAFKGLSAKDITVDQPITEGMGQTLANTIREMLEAAVEELGKMHETGSAEYKAAMETLRKEVKLALGKDDLQEAMHGEEEYTPMMPPKPVKIEPKDGDAAALAMGIDALRKMLPPEIGPDDKATLDAIQALSNLKARMDGSY
jgi:hypothetical protein